jgi:alkaline phosphatase D
MNDNEGFNSKDFIKEKYIKAKTSYSYYNQMQSKLGTKVVGIWDDHDYGLNNGGKEFLLKDFTRKLLLDFIVEPLDSVCR